MIGKSVWLGVVLLAVGVSAGLWLGIHRSGAAEAPLSDSSSARAAVPPTSVAESDDAEHAGGGKPPLPPSLAVMPPTPPELPVVEAASAEEPRAASLLQLVNEAAMFNGKTVATEGMVFHNDRMPDGHFMLYRFVITCCAADATPVGMLVGPVNTADYKVDSWVRVEGETGRMEVDGTERPVMRPRSVRAIEPPDNPFLSQAEDIGYPF